MNLLFNATTIPSALMYAALWALGGDTRSKRASMSTARSPLMPRFDLLALSVNQLDKEGNPLVSSLSGVTFYLDHIEGERYRVRIPAA